MFRVTQLVKSLLPRIHDQIAGRGLQAFRDARSTRRINRREVAVLRCRCGEGLAERVPRALFVFAQITHQLPDQRQIGRRQRQIVPASIKSETAIMGGIIAMRGIKVE